MIPFVDLKAQYVSIREEVNQAIQGVLDTCQFTLGEEVAAFEGEFAAYCHVQHGVAVNTGTSALHLALLAAGVGPGDEVITPAFTFVATAAAVHYCGARPVLVDIDPRFFNMDPNRIEAAVTRRTRAIVPVHLYGQPADMDAILDIARRHGLTVIEDACQAHGAAYKGRPAGSLADMGCFSFYPGKNLGAYGEGGMMVTNHAQYARTARMLRDWGAEKKYQHVMKGFNYRMEGMQGAILRVKLRRLEDWTESRRAHATRYDHLLGASGVSIPPVMKDTRHVYHIYAIRSPQRGRWQDALSQQAIQTGIHYPYPVHLLPAYSTLGYRAGDFPHSELAAAQVLSLPMYAELPAEHLERVSAAIGTLANSGTASRVIAS